MAQLFWSDDLVTLYLGDCRDVLPELPDGGVDLVLTDPPYGVGVDYGEGLHDSEENWYKLHSEVMPQLLRISPRVLIFASQIRRLRWWYTSFPPDWLFCWYKGAVEGMAAHVGFNYWEPVLVYGKQVHAIGDAKVAGPTHKPEWHPAPKPLSLVRYLVHGFSSPGMTVLDPFLGSGTTGVAAVSMQRRFIGIEINREYLERAAERIAQARRQLPLFSDSCHTQLELEPLRKAGFRLS